MLLKHCRKRRTLCNVCLCVASNSIVDHSLTAATSNNYCMLYSTLVYNDCSLRPGAHLHNRDPGNNGHTYDAVSASTYFFQCNCANNYPQCYYCNMYSRQHSRRNSTDS